MVTIDLNLDRQWEALFQKVEAGEALRVMRGDHEVAIVMPSPHDRDQAELDAWAATGMKAWAEISPPDEFADWKQPHGTR